MATPSAQWLKKSPKNRVQIGSSAVSIVYSRVNQAYFVMWHDQVLRIFNSYSDAEAYAEEITIGPKPLLQANAPQPAWLMPVLIGGAIAAGLWLWASSTKAATPTCPVDLKKFNDWLIAKELAGECVPELAVAPATYSDLQKLALAPGEFHPYVLVLGDGSFWYYSNYSEKAERSENLKNQYQTFAGGSLKGHPADLFMVA